MDLPPHDKGYKSRDEAAMNQVDAIVHLGATRAREGLAYREKLLILDYRTASSADRTMTSPGAL